MHLKTRRDPRLRSLLQKATRRGAVEVVERVAAQLDSIGDTAWLRARAAVITFEECWPHSPLLAIDRTLESKLRVLRTVAQSTKQKDAAGLGALAYAYRQGDVSTMFFAPDQRMLHMVVAALSRPNKFFRWALEEAASEDRAKIVRAAQLSLPAATWEWDKACIIAGGLLGAIGTIPTLNHTDTATTANDFPYWIALDKHTGEGKVALHDVAAEIRVNYRQLLWTSFYCESARVNELEPSKWFVAECAWRLSRVGLTYEEATDLWIRASTHLQERLSQEAIALRKLVVQEQFAYTYEQGSFF